MRELRAAGLAEWTISGICRAANRVFKFARRHCSWRGDNPFAELEKGERPRPSATPERRIYVGGELAQVLAAATEPWRTLFRLASVVGARESELLGLWWEDLELARSRRGDDPLRAFQVDRDGKRVELKTEESKATLPLPRSTALMLLEHKARTPAPTSPRSYVFGDPDGPPARAAQRAAGALPGAGAGPRRGRPADLPGAVRERQARAPGARRTTASTSCAP